MLTDPKLLSLDLAALRTLKLVYRLGSFSAAAAELDVKQSSVSYTIDRLRRALNDPLFVRQGGGITATDRCREAIESATLILAEAERFGSGEGFDPRQIEATVTITTGYYIQSVIMPGVIRRARNEAKGLIIRVLPPTTVDAALFDHNSDLTILPIPYEGSGVYSKVLLLDHDAILMDPKNPLANETLDVETYATADHVGFHLGLVPGHKQAWVRELTARGFDPKITITTFDGLMVPCYVVGTDLIATMPSRASRQAATELAVVKSPLDITQRFTMYWTAASDRSPLSRWLRQLFEDEAAAAEGPVRFESDIESYPQESR